MNGLMIFDNKEFGNVRIIKVDDKEMFGATDIAKSLGYSNPSKAINDHCKEKGITIREVLTNGGKQNIKFINEGNLYRLISKSKLPNAEKFEEWVFDEVLPSIRKTGGYIPTNENESDADIMAKALMIAQKTIENKSKQIEEMKPKALFADAVSTSKTTILIGDLAKLLHQNGVDTGQKRLFKYLRENGYLIKRKGSDYNSPTQSSMDKKLFEIKETTITHGDGHVTINKTTKVTGKGQQYFINKFLDK